MRVRGDDYERLGDAAESLVRWFANEAYMRMVDGRCAALAVRGGKFACSVYDARPQICRDLARGSPACEAERWEKRGGGRVALPVQV